MGCFEAGALAKSIDKSRVIPLLFGIEPINLQGPLLNFQAATFRQSEITKMLRGINFALGDNALDGRVLDSSIEKWWPELEGNINSIMAEAEVGSTVEFRTDRELLEETLQLARAVYYGSTVSGGEPILLRTLDYLKLTNRIIEALQAENIYYVGDLAIRTEAELLQARGMNKPGIDEIKTALAMRGLTLGLIMENWPPSGLG